MPPSRTAAGGGVALPSRWVLQRDLLASYDRLLARRLEPHLGQRLLEVGAGVGNMTRYLLNRELLAAVDLDAANVQTLRQRLGHHRNLVCIQVDITSPCSRLSGLGLDSALCSNVLEHIEDDALALRQISSVLRPGASLVVIVPAFSRLYCDLDAAAGHYRRYSRNEISALIGTAGYDITGCRVLNPLGAIGWIFNGRLAGRSTIPDSQLRLFNRLALVLNVLDPPFFMPVGLSILVTATKP